MGLNINGIECAFVLSEGVDQRPEYDPSGTDQLYTAVTIRTEFVLNALLTPSLAGEDVTTTAARIRHMLTAPRRPLYYAIGSSYLINLPTGLDDANGPKIEVASIISLNPSTFIVKLSVTVRLTDCAGEGDSAAARGYLSLRWNSVTTYAGDSWLCTKRISGLLILSSRNTTAPDDYRGLVTPLIERSFRRESAEYALDETGLRYRFSFVDRELMRELPLIPVGTAKGNSPLTGVAPQTALKMSGNMVETVPLPGAVRQGQIHLRLEASKLTHPRDLLNLAIGIAMQRAREADVFEAKTKDGNMVLIGGSFTEVLDDDKNAVVVQLQWKMKPIKAREDGKKAQGVQPGQAIGIGTGIGQILGGNIVGGVGTVVGGLFGGAAPPPPPPVNTVQGKEASAVAVNLSWVGKPLLGSFGGQSVAPALRGTADAVRMAAGILYDPCGGQVSENTLAPTSENTLVGANGDGSTTTVRELRPDDLADDDDAEYSDDDGPGIWDYLTMRAVWKIDTGKRVLPATTATGTAAMVQMHHKTAKLTVEVSGRRIGGQPGLPAAESDDPNVVFETGSIVFENLSKAADGVTNIYEYAVVNQYAALDANKISMAYPIPPFLTAALVRDLAVKSAGAISGVVGGDMLQTAAAQDVNPYSDGAVALGLAAFGGVSGSDIPPINP